MSETEKRKASIREEDVLLLLNKYSPAAILNLLKEVAQFAGVKIDWNALVKGTSTGISSAREYQMLWRHLAYRDLLLEKLEAGAEPLDDDSDLEFELEPFPVVSGETSTEAAACVKILISSGLPNETNANRTTVEPPLPISTSNGQASCTISDKQLARSNRGVNTAVSVSLQKQPQATAPSAEVLDGNGSTSASGPAKKKRKLWTKEEDMELIAAVDKCGEGNWANILKGDFKHDRTASQLSQRWSIIRKKRANLIAGNGCNPTSSVPTEAHMATWQAVNMAIKMPIIGGISTRRPSSTGALQSADAANSSVPSADLSEATIAPAPEVPNQSQQPNNLTTSQKGVLNHVNKSRASTKVPTITVKPLGGPSSIIQAAAFAAGGRIATPSTAASHFKAAQSKNAVHIRRPGGALASSTLSGSKPSSSMTTMGPQPSNVRGTKTPISPKDPEMTPNGSKTASQGICSSSGQRSPTCNATTSNQPTEQVRSKLPLAGPECADAQGNAEPGNTSAGFDTSGGSLKEENRSAEEIKLDNSVPHDQVDLLNLDVDVDKNAAVNQMSDNEVDADCQVAIELERASTESDPPRLDTTVVVGASNNEPTESTPEVLNDGEMATNQVAVSMGREIVETSDNKPTESALGVLHDGEMAENQVTVNLGTEKGNMAENQMPNSDTMAIDAEQNGTLGEAVSQNPTSDDNGAVRG